MSNRGTDYLREIEAREGRTPNRQEQIEATKLRRQQMGASDENLNPNAQGYPYKVPVANVSEWGAQVEAKRGEPTDEIFYYRDAPGEDGLVEDTPVNDTAISTQEAGPDVTAPISTLPAMPKRVSELYAFQRAQIDSIIKGNTETFDEDVALYSQGLDTIQDEMITYLEKQYSDEFMDRGVLENIYDLPPEEQIARITSEYNRLDSQKEEIRTLLALNMMRQGLGDRPTEALDGMYTQLVPAQIEGLYKQRRAAQKAELDSILNPIIAQAGEGFTTANAVGEIIRQDIIPFYGASTRVVGTNKFLPHDVEIATLRRGFPGEVRQELREWWVQANHEERLQYLTELQSTWDEIRKGPSSALYTKYLVIENLMGTFTDRMLYEDDPTDTFDRIMGNLDTALGAVVSVGLLVKRGKSIFGLFTGRKESLAKQAATAGGSDAASEALDESINALAVKLGWSPGDAGIPDLPRPKQLELDFGTDVELDTVVNTTTANAERRQRILNYNVDAEQTLIDDAAKLNAVERQMELLDAKDTVHIHHKMSTVKGMANGEGVEITATVGSRSGEGWISLSDLMDDMIEMNPYQEFRIMRRNKEGKLEELDISWEEVKAYRDKGVIPRAMDEFLEVGEDIDVARHFGMRRLGKISNEELAAALDSDWVDPGSPVYNRIRKELNDRAAKAGPDADNLLLVNGEQLFVQFDTKHFYDAMDMQKIEGFRYWDIPGVQSATRLLGKLFPPIAKFDKLYDAARKAYFVEEATLQELSDILAPFNKLKTDKRLQVNEMMEWIEDYAKDMHHETGLARAPSIEELIGEFSHFDDEVFEAYLAVKEANDAVYDLFNRRLYRDLNNRGGVTARGATDDLPQYHGRPMDTASRDPELKLEAGHYYDPVRKESVYLDADALAEIVHEGGGAVKLDFAIDLPGGGKGSKILARKGEYEMGKLGDRPLAYYEGYNFRFYEDPYYIVKRTYGATVDGKALAKGDYIDEAVRTAPSWESAKQFLRGATDNGKGELIVKGEDDGVVFVIEHAKQIENTEGTLYQKQAMHREGRMFWDQRSMKRLPNTDGNRAKVSDPYQAMQKGLAMAMRQSTQEGLFDSMKVGFKNEFNDLPIFTEKPHLLELEGLEELEKALKKGKNETFGDTRARYRGALEYIRYMRTQLGTDTFAVPALRAYSINILNWLDTASKGKLPKLFGKLQKHAMTMDPFARGRKIAYGAFMVLRPGRQVLLQSMQISMLTGLDPKYIASGKIFFDSYGLRRGLTRYRRAGFDDGWSDTTIAKKMGLTKKEYKRLVEEFHRSGIMGSVNTHALNAQGRNLSAALPVDSGPMGRFAYNARARGRSIYNALGKGFEMGEQANLTTTYMLALRRIKKKYDVKDITKMSRTQWDEVLSEADGLALAMTRPNKFAYQSGVTGLMFQFMSFQHRALLTFAGLNPKLTKMETAQIWLSNYILWGSNVFGAEEWTREFLAQHGIAGWGQTEILPGVTMQDVMVAGIIETGLNGMLRVMNEEHNDLNIGLLAPGAAISELYQGFYDLLTSAPVDMEMLGPFSNQASGFVKGAKFMRANVANQYKSPDQKLVESLKFFTQHMLPGANDLITVWESAQIGEWRDKAGDSLGIQTTMTGLLARGVVGIRPEEEYSIYRARRLIWESQEEINGFVKRWRPVLKQVAEKWVDGEYNDEYAYEMASVVMSLSESAPEGVRQEIYRRLMTEPTEDGRTISGIVAKGMSGATLSIRKLAPHIDNSSLTPEQKQVLKDLINTTAQGYIDADAEHNKMIQKQIDERGNEE